MAKELKPRISVSEDILSTDVYDREIVDNNLSGSFRAAREIFRNNTTAVEVIVKEIRHKGQKKIITYDQTANTGLNTINTLKDDIEKLRGELHKANLKLDEARKGFKVILCQMKKQLEGANQRELKTQTRNLALQLEKEKLRTLLESKSNLVTRLKKELFGTRRTLKAALKGIRVTLACSDNVHSSDVEYEEFEKDLINNAVIAVTGNCLNEDSNVESSMNSKVYA